METILERKIFTASPEISFGKRELLERARKELGYSPSALNNQEAVAAHRVNELAVASALESLGIEPFDSRAVDKYQRAEVKKIERKGSCAFVKAMHKSSPGEVIVVLGGVVMVLSLIFGAVSLGAMADGGTLAKYLFAARMITGWLGFIVGSWIICMIARHKKADIHQGEWISFPIGGSYNPYRNPVPDFAIERALQVKQALPETNFYVSELQERWQEIHMQVSDPFLVMDYKGIQLYLDVWDEPKFEGRRVV